MRNSKKIIIALVVALLGTSAFYVYFRKQKFSQANTTSSVKTQEIASPKDDNPIEKVAEVATTQQPETLVQDQQAALPNDDEDNAIASVESLAVKAPFQMPAISQTSFPDRTCDITNYGAANGKSSTAAISNAIKDCASLGGGHVLIPAGTWQTGPIHLENNIDLKLDKDAKVSFSTNPDDYLPAVFSRYEGIEYYNYSPLIYAYGKKNIAITGQGQFIGNGASWMQYDNDYAIRKIYSMGEEGTSVKDRIFGSKEKPLRPNFLQLINCDTILLSDFTIQSGPMWTIDPVYSSNIIIRGLNIRTSNKNNDGIDIDSSRNVLIENNNLSTHDDSIVLKSGKAQDGLRVNKPTENVVIRNNTIANGHGGIAFGSEIAGGINNVYATGNHISGNSFGIRLKAMENEKGSIKNVWLQNTSIGYSTDTAIQFTTDYGSDTDQEVSDTGKPLFNNINISGVTGAGNATGIEIGGQGLSNIKLTNINLGARSAGKISDLKNSSITSVKVNGAILK